MGLEGQNLDPLRGKMIKISQKRPKPSKSQKYQKGAKAKSVTCKGLGTGGQSKNPGFNKKGQKMGFAIH